MASREEKGAKLTKAFEDLLRAVGRSPGTYPEVLDTPLRTASMWLDDLLDGYEWSPAGILAGGAPVGPGSSLVIVRDLYFHSVCPHHLLPFHGLAHVAYLPSDRIIGFSNISRLVNCFAHRLTLQEEIGTNVAEALVEHLGARGAACMLDAEQLCMVVRGVRQAGSRAVTTAYSGVFTDDHALRLEFLTAIGAGE
jgi:GTP cyclohydrolase IA